MLFAVAAKAIRDGWSFLLVLCLVFASVPTRAEPPFPDGASGLFIGHSFLVPVARQFDLIARSENYERHEAQIIFAPGAAGTPGGMWNNPRMKSRIENVLDDGDIEIFGVAGMGRTTTLEQLDNWLKLALSYNAETTFVITQIHVPGGPRATSGPYRSAITTAGDQLYDVVKQLRDKHPTADIVFINHGFVAGDMLRRFEGKDLKDVTLKAGFRRNALFRDGSIGHAGQMMDYVSALVWLEQLYGKPASEMSDLEYDRVDVEGIATAARAFHAKYD